MTDRTRYSDEMTRWIRKHKEAASRYDDDALRSTNLLENGILDSLDLLDLVSNLEETFSCKLELGEFDDHDLRTIQTIAMRIEAQTDLQKP
jgi:acyl carrier protein